MDCSMRLLRLFYYWLWKHSKLQCLEQPPEVFYKKRCPWKFIHRKTSVPGLRPATLLKKRFWHRCFPVNFTKFLRTSFSQNTSRRLPWSMSLLLTLNKLIFSIYRQIFMSVLLIWQIRQFNSFRNISAGLYTNWYYSASIKRDRRDTRSMRQVKF